MDHKWAVIAARAGVRAGIVSAVAWALMDYASQHKERGSVEGFDTETYAVYSGFSEDEVRAVIQAITEKDKDKRAESTPGFSSISWLEQVTGLTGGNKNSLDAAKEIDQIALSMRRMDNVMGEV